MKSRLFIFIILLSGLILVGASNVEIGFGEGTGQTGVNVFVPGAPIFNNNTAFVNQSRFWDTLSLGPLNDVNSTQHESNSGTLTIKESWISSLWCKLTGCTMTGDINTNSDIIMTNSDTGIQRPINASSTNANGVIGYQLNNDVGANIALSIAGSGIPDFASDSGIITRGGRTFIVNAENKPIVIGHGELPEVNFTWSLDPDGTVTQTGDLVMNSSTIFLDVLGDHFIKLNSEGTPFNGIALNSTWFGHNLMRDDGEVTYIFTWENITQLFLQAGRNNSFSGVGNSFGVVPGYMAEENFKEVDTTINMTKVSNYPFLCDYFNQSCEFFADTRGNVIDDLPGGPLLWTMGDLEVWQSAAIQRGLTVFQNLDFIGNDGNDVDLLFNGGLENGKLHIRDNRLILANITLFDNVVCNFDAGDICEFYLESIAPEVGRDWDSVPDLECHQDRCANAKGGNEKVMAANSVTLGATNINISFWLTSILSGGDTFEIEVDDNLGSTDIIFTETTIVGDTLFTATLPGTYDNLANLTTRFILNGQNSNREVWVDDIRVQATLSPSVLINESYEGGRIVLGEERGNLSCGLQAVKRANEDTFGTEWFMEIGSSDCAVDFVGNVTFTDSTVINQTVIGDLTVTGNITQGGELLQDLYVNVDGDTMTGTLFMSSADIYGTGGIFMKAPILTNADKNVISVWQLEGNPDSLVLDSMGKNHGSNFPSPSVECLVGNCSFFQSGNSAITIPNSDNLENIFAVEVLVKKDSSGANVDSTIFNNSEWVINWTSDDKIRASFGGKTVNTTVLNDDQWYHVAAIFKPLISAGELSIWIDGIENTTDNINPDLITPTTLNIGNNFEGYIDEIATYELLPNPFQIPVSENTILSHFEKANDGFNYFQNEWLWREIDGSITTDEDISLGDNSFFTSSEIYGVAPTWTNADTSMISYWSFETVGDNRPDSVGGNHAEDDCVVGSFIVGSSLSCDGTESAVAPDSASLDLTNNLSIEAWIQKDFLEQDGGILNKTDYGMVYISEGFAEGHILGFIGSNEITSAAASIDDSKHHIVMTYNGTNLSLYIDTVLVNTTVSSDPISSISDLYIARNFDGQIDEVALYDQPISQETITNHYQKSLEGFNYLRFEGLWRTINNIATTSGDMEVGGQISSTSPVDILEGIRISNTTSETDYSLITNQNMTHNAEVFDFIGDYNFENETIQFNGADFLRSFETETSVSLGFLTATSGAWGTFIGREAGENSVADQVTAIGYRAGDSNTQDALIAVGYQAGISNSGTSAIFVGLNAGNSNSGDNVVGIGSGAAQNNNVDRVTAVGIQSGQNNVGERGSFFGYLAGLSNTGRYTTGIGAFSADANTGANVTALGYASGFSNSGDDSVFIGYGAGQSNTDSDMFIVKQSVVNSDPLILGNFSSGDITIEGGLTSPSMSTNEVNDTFGNVILDTFDNKLNDAFGTTIFEWGFNKAIFDPSGALSWEFERRELYADDGTTVMIDYANDGEVTLDDNNLSTTGDIIATSFIGDGSQLTGISGSGIWDNVSGVATYEGNVNVTQNMSATFFIGDGSLLTGIIAESNVSSYRNLTEFNASIEEVSTFNFTLMDDIQAYYKLDGNNFSDHTNNSNALTNSGTLNTTGKLIDGRLYSSTDTMEATGFSQTGDSYSIQMWLNPVADSGVQILYDDFDSGFGRFYIWGTHSGLSSQQKIGYFDGTTSRNWNVAMTTGSYNHYVFVFDDSQSKAFLYINGVKQAAEITYNGFQMGTNLRFNDQAGVNSFVGEMDEMGIWNRTLSETEVSTLFNESNAKVFPYEVGSFNTTITTNNTFNFSNTIVFAEDFVVESRMYDGDAAGALRNLKTKSSEDRKFSDIDYTNSGIEGDVGFGFVLKALSQIINKQDGYKERMDKMQNRIELLESKLEKAQNKADRNRDLINELYNELGYSKPLVINQTG